MSHVEEKPAQINDAVEAVVRCTEIDVNGHLNCGKPLRPESWAVTMLITLLLLALLGGVFLRGFKEAIGIAVLLVGV